MFNTSYYHAGNSTNNFKINAVTGAILKNHPNSWFEKFHLNSERAKQLLKEGGHTATKTKREECNFSRGGYITHEVRDPDKDITVLQMVICGDMEVMAELVYTKEYEIKLADDKEVHYE